MERTTEERAAFLRKGVYEFTRISLNELLPYCRCGFCHGVAFYDYNLEHHCDEIVAFDDTFDKAIDKAIEYLVNKGIEWKY